MSKKWKIALIVSASIVVLASMIVGGGIYLAQSDWLREKVRQGLVATMERATGGKIEIGKFQFDWKTLTAEVDDFVLHGTEPASGPPLLRVPKLIVGLKIISLAKQSVDVSSVRVESPQGNLLIAADGSTNIPNPKVPSKGTKTAPETILDLRIGEFSLVNGAAEIHAAGQPPRTASYDVAGKRLQSRFTFDRTATRYDGSLVIDPVNVRWGDYRPTEVIVNLTLALEKNNLRFSEAKLATPASRLTFSGAVDNFTAPVLTAKFDTNLSLKELNSVFKIKPTTAGNVHLTGDARAASADDYRVTGTLDSKNFSFFQDDLKISNVRADTSFELTPELLDLKKARIAALGGTANGQAIIRKFEQFEISGQLRHLAISTLAALETDQQLPYDGLIDGPFSVRGRFADRNNRSLAATAHLSISPAAGVPVHGDIDAKFDGASSNLSFANSFLALPNTRLDASGVLGQRMRVTLESHNLDDLLPAIPDSARKSIPVKLQQGTETGSIRFDGTVFGKLDAPRVEGRISGQNFIYSDQLMTSLTGDVIALETGASIRNANLVYRNLQARFQGSVGLRDWKPDGDRSITGTATLQNAAMADLLQLAGRKDIPLTGTLSASTQISGTVGEIQAAANLTLTNGSAYSEPFDRITGKLDYQNGGTQTATVQWRAGTRQLDLTARYQHVPGDLQTGQLHFEAATNRVALNQIAALKKFQLALAGTAIATVKGDASITKGIFKLGNADADLAGSALTLDVRRLGDAHLTAHSDGRLLKVHVDSNFAQADIKGDGSWQMTGEYPGSAEVTFARIDLASVRHALVVEKVSESFDFSGLTAGKLSVRGPLLKLEALNASLEIPQLEIRPSANTTLSKETKEIQDVMLQNTEPIRVSMENSVIRVESARFRSLNTDLALLGSIDLKQKSPLNLNVNGRADLRLIHTIDSDIESSGTLAVRVSVRGSFDDPQLGGTADLRGGNFSMAGIPNGLTNATGRIVFDENRANIENLNATTGGGTIRLEGFMAFSGPMVSFRLLAAAKNIRVRYPEGVSSVSDADLSWTGTTERSVVAGDVSVEKVSYNPQSDLSSVLALSGPGTTQTAPTGILAGIQFDIRVRTAPEISFQTGLVSGLQTEANLRLKGTPANPSLLGRITISGGELNVFGNKYVINQGTVSFFNPAKIEPVVNVDLETRARGVTVTLTVSGPISKLNVTYQSDPPLQFNDIVGLLATGKVPSDPTIAARQTDTQQSWTQLGATALVGQAIASPVAGRLQRFLGVSKLKIDPLLPGLGGIGSGTVGAGAGARLSLEQQITPDILFDYVISTNSTSSQIVRVEWAFSKHWSAVIIREENSAFGIDFQYKKRFK
jgi:translocation and assembly module TamB